MNPYVSAVTIRSLREKNHLTQSQLAEQLCVSDKTISKWETAKGLPDITLLEPLANALHISVMELLSGDCITNKNKSANMMRSAFYVCPICGNVVHSTGQAVISCCGVTLPPLEAESCDEAHDLEIDRGDDDIYITLRHDMSKSHHISFLAYLTTDRCEIIKLYPESLAQGRFTLRYRGRHAAFYAYCNHHGLFFKKL